MPTRKLTVDIITAAIQGFEIQKASMWDPLESTCRHASLSIL